MDHHIEYRRKVVHCREFLLILNLLNFFFAKTSNYFPSVVKFIFDILFLISTPDRPIDPFVVLIIASALWRDWSTHCKSNWHERTVREKQKKKCLSEFFVIRLWENVIWCFIFCFCFCYFFLWSSYNDLFLYFFRLFLVFPYTHSLKKMTSLLQCLVRTYRSRLGNIRRDGCDRWPCRRMFDGMILMVMAPPKIKERKKKTRWKMLR